MSGDAPVVALVLFAALLHASWNALVKASGDKLALQTLVMLGGSLVMLPVVLTAPPLERALWPTLAGALVLHLVYGLALVRAYQLGDLSQIYPIARGAAPAFVAVGAWIAAGEALRGAEIAAIALISIAIGSLAWLAPASAAGRRRATAVALATAAVIASYSVIDGLGSRRASDVRSYVGWIHLLEGPAFAAIAFAIRGRGMLGDLARHARVGLPGGVVAACAYALVLWAMRHLPISHVVALRETSVIAAAAIGARFLGEPFGRPRLIAATIVAAAAALLRLA